MKPFYEQQKVGMSSLYYFLYFFPAPSGVLSSGSLPAITLTKLLSVLKSEPVFMSTSHSYSIISFMQCRTCINHKNLLSAQPKQSAVHLLHHLLTLQHYISFCWFATIINGRKSMDLLKQKKLIINSSTIRNKKCMRRS